MKRGFTLIELLHVIGIIAILASIVIVAINPTEQLRKTCERNPSASKNCGKYLQQTNKPSSTLLLK